MPDNPKSVPEEAGQASPLLTWERIVASLLGATGATFGGIAVFVTSNQAGSAALLLISAVFLLLGIQGTPLIKFTSGSNSVELERRRISRQLIEKSQKESDPEAAKAYEQAASIASAGPVDLAESIQSSAMKYESSIFEALTRLGLNVSANDERSSPVDYFVYQQGAPTAVIVKYRRRIFGTNDLDNVLGTVTRTGMPTLVVTNAPVSNKVQEFNSMWGERHPRVEVVTWKNAVNDQHLHRALLRTKGEPQPESPADDL